MQGDGKEMCLDLEVVLSDVDGNDKVRPLRSEEFFNQGFVFLSKEGQPCLWCVRGERGSVLICPTCNGLVL